MSQSLRLASVAPWDTGAPAIHGPAVTGASASKPLLYTIPATGERPMQFQVEGLPEGLAVDAVSGRITGRVKRDGVYRVLLQAGNRHGTADKEFDLVIGQGLALTPPMGWNSWNAWRRWVDDAKVRSAAEMMVQSGLAARGYTYINIDSCWQGERGGKHRAIQPNRKFPDMQALADFIHGQGLKFGIYSTPWVSPWGCSEQEALADWGGPGLIGCSSGKQDPDYPRNYASKYIGLTKHEADDVAQWIEWEVDFLKYDWAPTAPKSLERMGRILKAAPRDVVFSVCTGARLAHAGAYKTWTNMWRGMPDTADTWQSLLRNGFYTEDAMAENWRPHVGPGHWNDLDMTALGPQFHTNASTVPCRLSLDEQITHMSLWALYPSPLILSCNLGALDEFTLRLFANEEIIAVNQDRLGRPAVRVGEVRVQPVAAAQSRRDYRIQARPLADGSLAVGVFNLAETEDEISIGLRDLELSGRVAVRNLWERRDLGHFNEQVPITVPAHGAQMLKIRR